MKWPWWEATARLVDCRRPRSQISAEARSMPVSTRSHGYANTTPYTWRSGSASGAFDQLAQQFGVLRKSDGRIVGDRINAALPFG